MIQIDLDFFFSYFILDGKSVHASAVFVQKPHGY